MRKQDLYRKLSESNLQEDLVNQRQQNLANYLNYYKSNKRFKVATVHDGVIFINDGDSASVAHTFESLESIIHPVTLIMGGLNGLADYSVLTGFMRDRVENLILFGVGKDQLGRKFEACDAHISLCDSVHEAVHTAYLITKKPALVLFSPASQAVEFNNNIEERQTEFYNALKSLI